VAEKTFQLPFVLPPVTTTSTCIGMNGGISASGGSLL
jgi:hypothetical protein